jgi:hypothetical protein
MNKNKLALTITIETLILSTGIILQYLQLTNLANAPNWALFILYYNLRGLGAVIAATGALTLIATVYLSRKSVKKLDNTQKMVIVEKVKAN